MLQCIAVCCSGGGVPDVRFEVEDTRLVCNLCCCGQLQCVAVCCSVLKYDAVSGSVLGVCCSVLQCVAAGGNARC